MFEINLLVINDSVVGVYIVENNIIIKIGVDIDILTVFSAKVIHFKNPPNLVKEQIIKLFEEMISHLDLEEIDPNSIEITKR